MKKAIIISLVVVLLMSVLSASIGIMSRAIAATCNSPSTPSSPSPADNDSGISITPHLDWYDCVNTSYYLVYFSNSSLPGYLGNTSTNTSYFNIPPDQLPLSYNTTYYWRIDPYNSSTCNTTGPTWKFTTKCGNPGTPTNASPSDSATNVSANTDLRWDNCSNTAYYQIYLDTNDPPTTLVNISTNNSWRPLLPLNLSTTYYWKVVANNGCVPNTSVSGDIWSFATECGVPGTPVNPSPWNGSTEKSVETDLSWDACVNTSYYDVYWGTNASSLPVYGSYTTNSCPLSTLDFLTKYYWKVVANNGCGVNASSPVWNFSTECPYPTAPILPSPSNSSHWVPITTTLDWDDEYASSYRIYLGNNSSSLNWVGNSTVSSYTPSSLIVNTKYYWRIVANNSCGNTSGPIWNFTTDCAVPSMPLNPSPKNLSDQIAVSARLSWGNCSNTSYYEVYLNTSPSFGSPNFTPTTNSCAPTLNPSTTYYWKVVSKSSCGSNNSSLIWNFTTACSIPTTPGTPSPADTSTGLSVDSDLSWGVSSYVASYQVYFGTNPSSLALNGSPTGNSWTLPTLNFSTTYYWKVVANNSCGNTSGSSSIWSFTTGTGCTVPSKPQAVSPGNGSANLSTSVTLNWSACTNATSYDLYLGTSETPVFNRSTTNTSYPASLNYSTQYYWRVVANSSCGNTNISDVWSFTTTCAIIPARPQILYPANGAVNLSMSVTLNWSACTNATSYDVYLGTSETPVFNRSTTNTTYSVSLNYSTRYYWKVLANSSCGNTNASDTWSFTTLCTIPPSKPQTPSPVNGSVNVSTSVLLDWADCANATSYDVYLGTSSTPAFNRSTTNTSYLVSLNYSTQYYWKIVANNSCGNNLSDVWNFTTASVPVSTPTPTISFDIGGMKASGDISSAGIIQQAVNITSADKKINMYIPAGTKALNNQKQPLGELNMSRATVYPAASRDRTVIAAFDFDPDGATFVPGIVVTLTYTHGMIPAGVNESKLIVASYNESSKGWEYYNDCVVNASANTITFTVSHFTTFAIQTPSIHGGGLGIWVIITIIFAAAIILGVAGGLYIKYRRVYGSLYYEDEGDADDKYDQYREDREDEGDFKF